MCICNNSSVFTGVMTSFKVVAFDIVSKFVSAKLIRKRMTFIGHQHFFTRLVYLSYTFVYHLGYHNLFRAVWL